MPVVNPYSKLYGWWCAYVLFMDATYTAFVVPIGVGFNTSSVQWDWVGYFDFIAGKTLLSMCALFICDAVMQKHLAEMVQRCKNATVDAFLLHAYNMSHYCLLSLHFMLASQ